MGAYEYQGNIGISDSDLESQFIIYPMPFHDFTTIQWKKSIDFCELNIFNLFGQKIKTIISNSKSQIKIERGNLRSGMYIYELKTTDKYFSKGILTIID
jgi:Secretion system C-terminal sorting domain